MKIAKVNKGLLKFLLALLIVIVGSCSKDEETPPRENETLVASELFVTKTANELRILLGLGQSTLDPSILQYDVEVYKVTYHTKYNDQSIVASGLVFLPKTADELGMVSYQHGTITANVDAPTNHSASNPSLLLYSAMAATGFIGVAPDFIGFGSSSNLLHPYYVEELTATSIVDNVKAARELAGEKGKKFSGKLFLAGYSEGGYATMAAHKFIEENGLNDFDLVASFPAAGGYDIKAMQEYFFDLETYDDAYYIAYVALAYKTTFGFSQPLTDFFQEPYATNIPTYFDGTFTGSQINEQLTTTIADLIVPDFRQNIDTKSEYAYFKNAFIENSLTDWAPKKKMFMYHGDADVTVPFENSVITYNKLIGNGATNDVIKFFVIQGADHATGAGPYILDIIPKMLALK